MSGRTIRFKNRAWRVTYPKRRARFGWDDRGRDVRTRLQAAWHELSCGECRVTWSSWLGRILNRRASFSPSPSHNIGPTRGDELDGGWVAWFGVTCVECPACAFTFDSGHTDDANGRYSCPECGQASHNAPKVGDE